MILVNVVTIGQAVMTGGRW